MQRGAGTGTDTGRVERRNSLGSNNRIGERNVVGSRGVNGSSTSRLRIQGTRSRPQSAASPSSSSHALHPTTPSQPLGPYAVTSAGRPSSSSGVRSSSSSNTSDDSNLRSRSEVPQNKSSTEGRGRPHSGGGGGGYGDGGANAFAACIRQPQHQAQPTEHHSREHQGVTVTSHPEHSSSKHSINRVDSAAATAAAIDAARQAMARSDIRMDRNSSSIEGATVPAQPMYPGTLGLSQAQKTYMVRSLIDIRHLFALSIQCTGLFVCFL